MLTKRRNRDSISKSRQIVRNDQGIGAFRKSCFTQHRSVEQIKLTQDTESDKEFPKPSPRLWDSRHTLKTIRRQDFDKKSNYSLLDEPGIA